MCVLRLLADGLLLWTPAQQNIILKYLIYKTSVTIYKTGQNVEKWKEHVIGFVITIHCTKQ